MGLHLEVGKAFLYLLTPVGIYWYVNTNKSYEIAEQITEKLMGDDLKKSSLPQGKPDNRTAQEILEEYYNLKLQNKLPVEDEGPTFGQRLKECVELVNPFAKRK
ncbi:uncharacterized protein LOC106155784 [Lingula anatina]|uniref:Uncharacterized protein LOC106155784 n=1 Tax=Lingula anatina TaxID=7574 RepID=A0A1S3HJD3_LINAN|nr:uncharacterized protein LOC106155784 [Lingula anatina]|eukprot:XP_013386240.1 uncharacterized protein LOC106155784 [Lingula anatina]